MSAGGRWQMKNHNIIARFAATCCDGETSIENCEPIPVGPGLEYLYQLSGVYIVHGEKREILQIGYGKNKIRDVLKPKLEAKNGWKDCKPAEVSAIILKGPSIKYADKIKRILKAWLKPKYR